MSREFFCFVRRVSLGTLLAGCTRLLLAANVPAEPDNHIYDPDFLLTRDSASALSGALTRFQTESKWRVDLAIFTSTPGLIDDYAAELDNAWNSTGYGLVIVFAPPRDEIRVLPSPQLSLVENPGTLTQIFRQASRSALAHGDYSGAATGGTLAVLRSLGKTQQRVTEPGQTARFGRPWLFGTLGAGVVMATIFMWFASRAWHWSNLFDASYRFPLPNEPAALRFGGKRSGGLMATIDFRARSKTKDT